MSALQRNAPVFVAWCVMRLATRRAPVGRAPHSGDRRTCCDLLSPVDCDFATVDLLQEADANAGRVARRVGANLRPEPSQQMGLFDHLVDRMPQAVTCRASTSAEPLSLHGPYPPDRFAGPKSSELLRVRSGLWAESAGTSIRQCRYAPQLQSPTRSKTIDERSVDCMPISAD